jgi:hypothetical protein
MSVMSGSIPPLDARRPSTGVRAFGYRLEAGRFAAAAGMLHGDRRGAGAGRDPLAGRVVPDRRRSSG